MAQSVYIAFQRRLLERDLHLSRYYTPRGNAAQTLCVKMRFYLNSFK